jgi:hypothetical protein
MATWLSSWLLLLVLAAAAVGVLRVHGEGAAVTGELKISFVLTPCDPKIKRVRRIIAIPEKPCILMMSTHNSAQDS